MSGYRSALKRLALTYLFVLTAVVWLFVLSGGRVGAYSLDTSGGVDPTDVSHLWEPAPAQP